jgi:hypothetical protein
VLWFGARRCDLHHDRSGSIPTPILTCDPFADRASVAGSTGLCDGFTVRALLEKARSTKFKAQLQSAGRTRRNAHPTPRLAPGALERRGRPSPPGLESPDL